MKTKKSISVTIFTIATVFSFLYLIFAAKPLAKEYHYTPEWVLNLSSPVTDNISPSEEKTFFNLGQTAGYFTETGKIALFVTFPSKVTISEDLYATYGTNTTNVELFNKRGELVGQIKPEGYPFVSENRVYTFLPGGASFVKCNESGRIEWSCENTIPITAFYSNKNYTTIGYADGNIKVLNNGDGRTEIDFTPAGSDLEAIYGVSLSSDGEYLACISGLEKQRFIITKKDKNQSKIIYHEYLPTELRRRSLIQFSNNNECIYYNYEGGLGIYNLKSKSNVKFDIKDRIVSIKENDSLIYVLGKTDSTYTVYIIEKTNSLQGKFSFESENAFIQTMGEALYIGKDNTISKIKVTKE
ncbi:MAG: WD40 repeat domain-containing protein [Treponema sp.]|nr:WD40 repeat domain-containing protein [Treponema sp.]